MVGRRFRDIAAEYTEIPMFQPSHDVAVDTLVAEEIYEFGCAVFIGPEILTWTYGS